MNKTDVDFMGRILPRAICGGFLLFAFNCRAEAGPIPPPIAARLDAAKWVVIGQISKIAESKVNPYNSGVYGGIANIAVKEVLKGPAVKTIDLGVVTRVTRDYRGATILYPRKLGQSGIWIIGEGILRDGTNGGRGRIVGRDEGFFCKTQEPDLRRIVRALNEKKWSEPVNGLRAWALVISHYTPWGRFPGELPGRSDQSDEELAGIIFGVKNVSDADIYLPVPQYRQEVAPGSGFFVATVKSTSGKTVQLSLDAFNPRSKRIPCTKLSPGEATYLDPDQYPEFGIDWREKLAPGKYSAVVTYKNDRADGQHEALEWRIDSNDSAEREGTPVMAWKGELKTTPLEFELTVDDVRVWKAPQYPIVVPHVGPKAPSPLVVPRKQGLE